MHDTLRRMLSLFPTMFLALLAHALLRLFVGGTLLYLGFRHIGRERRGLKATLSEHWPRFAGFFVWYLALVEIALGVLFILGMWTQAAAIVAAILSIEMMLFRRRLAHPSIPQSMYYVLLLGASLSLLITGAGVPAIDLPF